MSAKRAIKIRRPKGKKNDRLIPIETPLKDRKHKEPKT